MNWDGILKALNDMPVRMDAELAVAVKETAVLVRDRAVKKFGTYQPQSGDYPAWAQLAEATVEVKRRAGAEGDDPLIGHSTSKQSKVWPTALRNSIDFKAEGMQAVVGTNDPLGQYHEFGTEHIPPRPFLYPAAWEEEDGFHKRALEAAAKGMFGR